MAKKTDTTDWTTADKRYGWKYGCEGFVNQTEAGRIVGKSQPWMSAVLKSEDRKKRGYRGYPIRAGKSKENPREWMVCVRSLREYIKAREPLEV